MPTIRVPINLVWTSASGSPGTNTWHARLEDDPLAPDDLEVLTEILHDFYTAIAEFYPNTVLISWGGEGLGVGDDEGTIFESPGWSVAGTSAVAYLPPANCMLINWRTSGGGRSGKGKTFIGPGNVGLIEANGTPSEGARTALSDAAADLIESSDSALNGALGVYSRKTNVFRDFISAEVPNLFAILSSRRD